MAPRKDPAAIVVAFFETAPVETAQTVLAICKSILARRQPKTRAGRKPDARASENVAAGPSE